MENLELEKFKADIEHERSRHAACLSIAEGAEGWDVPGVTDSPAMIAVRKLRAEVVQLRRGFSRPEGEKNP